MAKPTLQKQFKYQRSVGGTSWGLPPQMVSVAEKETADWQEACMDFMDYQASSQVQEKIDDLKKYRVLSGDFDMRDYKYMTDPLSLSRSRNPNDAEMGGNSGDFDPEEPIVHYPIMVRPINVILGEYIKRITQLHGFYCKNESKQARNEYNRTKTEMIQNWAEQKIMARVMKKVQASGIKEGTPEYEQSVQQMTPEEIQEYVDRDYVDVAVQVNQLILKNMWKDQSLDSEFVEGFKHACISAKEFYHIYNVNNKTKIKNLSGMDVFYHKSPSVKWVSEGQFAGFRWMLTPSSIIDIMGNKLTKADMEEIEAMVNPSVQTKRKRKENTTGSISYDTSTYSDAYGNINQYDMNATIDMIQDYQRYGANSSFSNNYGLIKMVRAYWQSYRPIGWLTSYDENDEPVVEMVDENYKPKTDQGEYVEYTVAKQVYTGCKIGNNIYTDIGPYQDQIVDLDNLEYAPLPIEGALMNDTHTKPYSLVDLMLPWNELYNIVAYELKQDMNSSLGRVLFMSVDHIPNIPGFDMKKWYYWARKFKIAWVKQPKTGGANTFNQFSSADMSFAQQMTAKMEALEQIQMKCDAIAGFSPGRVAGQTHEDTLGQSNQQLVASVNQTEYLFFRHSKLIERVLNQALNLAKKGMKNNTFMHNLFDDYEQAYIDYDPEVILNQKVSIYVTNSSEDIRKRQMIENLMQPAMQNGADYADLSDMILAETISEVKQISNKLRRMAKQSRQAEQDYKNRELEMKQKHFEDQQATLLTINRERNTSMEEQAYIKTFGGVNNSNTQDIDQDGILDIFEFDLKQKDLFGKHQLKVRDQNFKEKKHADDNAIDKQRIKLEEQKNKIAARKAAN
jgi:hypothetical protein